MLLTEEGIVRRLRDSHFATIVTRSDESLASRTMLVAYVPEQGVFLLTRVVTDKIKQISKNSEGLIHVGEISDDLTKEMSIDDIERLGDVHLRQGDLQMAKAQYEKVLNMDPERVPARYKLAVIYLEKGAAQAAYDEFHKILDYDLNFAPLGVGSFLPVGKLGFVETEVHDLYAINF